MRAAASSVAWGCSAWLLFAQSPAHASDFTPLTYLLLGIAAAVFVVVFALIWFVTRWVRHRSLRSLLRAAAIAIFWTPVQFDDAGFWWPLCMTAGNISDLPNKSVVLISVIAVTAALWGIGLAWTRSIAMPATEMKERS